MSLSSKFVWGLIAGLAIVLVKIIGPDKLLVKSMILQSDNVEILFYILIAAITAILGGVSGLFTEETRPAKLMVFCASFPAMVSTYTSMPSDSIPPEAPPEQAQLINPLDNFSLISPAFAQTGDAKNECKETNFTTKLNKSFDRFLKRKRYDDQPYFSVVVASTEQIKQAEFLASKVYQRDKSFTPYVGCKKPGNKFYPIIVGNMRTKEEATELKGRFEKLKVFPNKPYLSYYEYRIPIFRPK